MVNSPTPKWDPTGFDRWSPFSLPFNHSQKRVALKKPTSQDVELLYTPSKIHASPRCRIAVYPLQKTCFPKRSNCCYHSSLTACHEISFSQSAMWGQLSLGLWKCIQAGALLLCPASTSSCVAVVVKAVLGSHFGE